jgi:hypothetical protein
MALTIGTKMQSAESRTMGQMLSLRDVVAAKPESAATRKISVLSQATIPRVTPLTPAVKSAA